MTTAQTPTQLQFPTREECAVPDLLAARAAATPDKPFLIFDEETWTYGDAAREAWRTANAFIDAGVAAIKAGTSPPPSPPTRRAMRPERSTSEYD